MLKQKGGTPFVSPTWREERAKGGYSLSRKRVSPFKSPERKVSIAGLGLEELHALRNVSAVYMASP